MICTEEVQRDIWLISDDPTVMCNRRNVEKAPRRQFNLCAIIQSRHPSAGDNHPDMLNLAKWRSRKRSDVRRPSPTRFVTRSADRHPADIDYLESALLKAANLVRFFKPLQHHFQHGIILSHISSRIFHLS